MYFQSLISLKMSQFFFFNRNMNVQKGSKVGKTDVSKHFNYFKRLCKCTECKHFSCFSALVGYFVSQ